MTDARWETIDHLFEEARTLPFEERAGLIERSCEDETIREEVMSLLEAYDEAGAFFESLADSLIVPAWEGLEEQRSAADPLELEGVDVGRYLVEEHLGGGGMGVVYRARDTLLNRPVALKFLSPHLVATEEAEIRFLREARATSALDHSNIATIYEIGTAKGDTAGMKRRFIAMGYYDGETLKAKIERGRLPVAEAVDYAAQMAEGLGAAHASGIVHRDVKPANVIVTEQGTVKLVDFGLAKAAEHSVITNPGRRMGTAAYMSPEQARGEDVDARADLWSLGVLLYEMLTGARAFHRGRDTATLYAIVHEEPPSLRSCRPELPVELEHIVQRCLAKEADKRYERAKDLLNDLEAVQRGEAPLNAHVTVKTPDSEVRSVAVLPFETLGAERATAFTKGIHGDVLTRLSNVGDLHVISRTSVRKYHDSDKSILEIGSELNARWVVEGEVQEAGGQVQVNIRLIDARTDRQAWAQDYRRKLTAENVFEIQSEITKKIAGALKAHLTPEEKRRVEHKPTENLIAYRLYAQGRRRLDQRTEEGMRNAVEHFERAIEQDSTYARAWAGLADALALLYDYGHEAIDRTLPRAEEAARRALALDPSLAEAHASLGLIHSNRHEGPAAIRELNRAVELQPSYAEAHNWLSWNYQLLGQPDEALKSARRAVELDPLSPEAVSNLGMSNLENGHLENALREARRVREIEPIWASVSIFEGLALYHLGLYEEATSVLKDKIVPWAGSGPKATLALTHVATGKVAQARELLVHFQQAGDHFAAGLLYAALGEIDAAFEAFKKVDYWDDWPTLSVHHLYPDVLGPLREDVRWQSVLRTVKRARGLEVSEKPVPPENVDMEYVTLEQVRAELKAFREREASTQTGTEGEMVLPHAAVAVLPFAVLGQDSTGPFIQGVHDDLIATLSRLSGLDVISRTSVMRYRDSDKPLPAIARELGVGWVLEGSIQQVNDKVRVRVHLVNARTDRQVWTQDYQRELTAGNLFEIQGEITRKIADSLKTQLTPAEERRVDRHPTENLEAYQLYVQGRAHLHERTGEAMQQAAMYFQRAIDLDPTYALAWSGLADACALLRGYDYQCPAQAPDPFEAAQRALELDPTLGEAHTSLGILHSYLHQDGPAALRALKRAIERKPSYAEAYVWLAWVHLLLGQPDEALEPAQTAVRLNPLAPAYRVFLAESHLVQGRTEDALREAVRAREIQPGYGLAHFMEALVLYHGGEKEKALSALEGFESLMLPSWGVPTHSEFRAFIAVIHAGSGDPERTRELLSHLKGDGDDFSIGLVHAALGEINEAFEAFWKVEQWESFENDHIRYFFPDVLSPVRSDPRYEDLMRKVDESWGLEG